MAASNFPITRPLACVGEVPLREMMFQVQTENCTLAYLHVPLLKPVDQALLFLRGPECLFHFGLFSSKVATHTDSLSAKCLEQNLHIYVKMFIKWTSCKSQIQTLCKP